MVIELNQNFRLNDKKFCITTVRLSFKMSTLKRLREQKNYSQGQLAYISKVNINTIRAYEQRSRDINKASADILRKLATALDCSMSDLLEDDAASRIKDFDKN